MAPPLRETVLFEATAYLIAALSALPELEGVAISDGPPSLGQLTGDGIIFADAESDQDWAAVGARNREETLSLYLVFYSVAVGKSQTVANERAGELFATVGRYCRADIKLGGLLWKSGYGSNTQVHKGIGDNARLCFIRTRLNLSARI